jgi:hypothetical protein
MKKFYLIALFAFVCNFAFAQIEQVSYRGAFAPAPAAMWTDSWTNFDPQNTAYTDEATVVNVSGDITANTTWTTGKTYKLTGLVFVKNNAVLTIQAGVVVKGVTTSNGTALIVTRGSRLNAIGTASAPIVFTSNQPAGSRAAGNWGGVVLLGRAGVSNLVSGNTGVNNIEGITATADTQYGGGLTPNDNDNSGILRYVRIEFGGYVFSANNEINGLTMGGVGRGTSIDYVQTSFTNDDSFEWFGGAVNCKHLVAYRGVDDDFDTDNGYKGAVQFALGIKDPAIADNAAAGSTSEGFESDNNPSSVTVTQSGYDNTSCVFSNCTLIGPSGRGASSVDSDHARPARLRRNSEIKVYNSIFLDFRNNFLFVDGSGAVANANANKLKFQNNIIAGVADASTPTAFTAGVNPTSLNSWFTSNNNSYVASSGILAAPYSGTPLVDYTGDFRPGTLAATGASFTDASIAALLPPVQLSDPNKLDAVAYRGAFAPAPATMWTDNWTNFDPQSTQYIDEANVVTITSDITTNTTWTAGTTYKLGNVIYVKNNATLTIEPGVVVKGITQSGGTALIITRGSKLNAIGTELQPIVFTSNQPAGSRAPGNWGGVVLLGNARYTSLATGNAGVNNIEGITSSADTQYGGGLTPNDADSSGTLKYVRIEFGGFVFSQDNEINGLTMGAVGSGTTIDYVQTSFTNDDSFEWFGGAVNCKHLVAFRGVDDDFDTDNGFKGTVQFALGIKDPALADTCACSDSEGFESDNNVGSVTVTEAGWDNTSPVFSNCTLIGPSGRGAVSIPSDHRRPARLRRNSEIKVYNSIFMDFRVNHLFIDGSGAVANANANTLKFQNNIIAGVADASFPVGVNPTSLNTWYTTNNNSYVASAGVLAAPYSGTPLVDYTGDFRPGTLAATGAKFDDATIAAVTNSFVPAVVTPLNICQGATGISPLTAVPTANGISLRWYTSATTTIFTTTAPTPTSGTVGSKTFYVAEVTSSGVSARVAIVVNVIARPTTSLAAITGTLAGLPASTSVGLHVGTTTEYTYSVVASVDPLVTSYLWVVPNGVNIVSGQGTNSIVVNFANVPAGAGFVGTITAQGVNAAGCPSVASKITLKKSLAPGPALKMFAANNLLKPVTSFGQFAGTSKEVILTATNTPTATGYQWELPAGVNLVLGGATPTVSTLTYSAEPFLSPIASVPTAVGTQFWQVTYSTYTGVLVNGVATNIVVSTAVQRIAGNATYTPTTVPYVQYGTVITSNLPSIVVDFAAASANTVTALYLGVKSLNGVGASINNNTSTAFVADYNGGVNPVPGTSYNVYTETVTPVTPPNANATSTYTLVGTSPSTARLLKVVSVTPAAPASIKSLDGTTSVTNISTYVGTDKSLTLTAAAVANASSYTWTLPLGVNVTAGATQVGTETSPSTWTSTSNSITVNYNGIASSTATVAINVKAKNNVDSSVDKLLTLTAGVPSTPTVTGSLAICSSATSDVVYTIAALATRATSYFITAPAGATVNGGGNTATIAAVPGATFTVNYPSGFISTSLAPLYINIASVNGFGSNLLNRVLKLNNTGAVCVTRLADSAVANGFSVVAYPNPSSSEFTIETSAKGAINAKVYDMQGRLVENANSTQVGSSLAPGVYNVIVSQGANTKSVRVIKQ